MMREIAYTRKKWPYSATSYTSKMSPSRSYSSTRTSFDLEPFATQLVAHAGWQTFGQLAFSLAEGVLGGGLAGDDLGAGAGW